MGRVAQWREALISIFRRFSTGVGDISGLGGGQLVKQLVYTMFITNNQASFHLW